MSTWVRTQFALSTSAFSLPRQRAALLSHRSDVYGQRVCVYLYSVEFVYPIGMHSILFKQIFAATTLLVSIFQFIFVFILLYICP